MSTVQLWISSILAILRVLISQSTEDIVLSRIQELSFSPYLISCATINRLRNSEDINPSEEQTVEEQRKYLPEETFARYITFFLICFLFKFLMCFMGKVGDCSVFIVCGSII